MKAKAEEEANAKAEAAAKAEKEAKAKAESAAKAEEEAKAKAESAAKAEEDAKARAIAAAKVEEEKTELKPSRKRRKKNRSQAKAKRSSSEKRIEKKSQEEEDNETKIIAASEDYAKAIALAMAEAETKPNENREETIPDAESLSNLDLSTFKSDDINQTIEDATEIEEISPENEEETQSRINTKNEVILTEEEVWPEETEVQTATIPSFRRRLKPINLTLVVPSLFAALIFVTLLLPYILPTSQYISTIEKLASDSISEQVKIGSLHVTFLPVSSVEASTITIGSNIKIKTAILTFSMFSSFNSDNLKEIELTGVSVLPSAYDNITKWSKLSDAPHLSQFKKIELKETKLEFKNISVPLLSGSIKFKDNNKFSKASFTSNDKNININISPNQNDFQLNISAKKWKPSLSSAIVLSDLDAKVIMNTGLFQITEIDSRLYDGVLKGTAFANWGNSWSLNGKFEVERVNIKEAAVSNNADIPMEGKLFSKVEFSSEAQEFEQLYDAMRINGTFHFKMDLSKLTLVIQSELHPRVTLQVARRNLMSFQEP